MCSALVRVDVALLRLMETWTEGQTDAPAPSAAGVAIFILTGAQIRFRVDLRANDESCLISGRVFRAALHALLWSDRKSITSKMWTNPRLFSLSVSRSSLPERNVHGDSFCE